MTTTYPSHHEGGIVAAREVKKGYDSMARSNILETKLATVNQQAPDWQRVVSHVQFNVIGTVPILNHRGATESWICNALGQMTNFLKGSLINMQYFFYAVAKKSE